MIGTKFASSWLTKLLASSGLLSLIAVMPALAAEMSEVAEMVETAASAETNNFTLYAAIAIGAAFLLLIIFKSSGSSSNEPAFAARCGPMWGASTSRQMPAPISYYESTSGATAAAPSSSPEPAFAARCGAMWATPTSRNA
ncbi:MAG: hypothetical protein JKY93_09785 [Gammaproteobacteria bacterium]|nr:hypothetical protein [Gammaproteobacteria bacterium]